MVIAVAIIMFIVKVAGKAHLLLVFEDYYHQIDYFLLLLVEC